MLNKSIDQALAAIQKCTALVVGDLVLDHYLFGETVRVSREAPVVIVKKKREEYRLGGAANVAKNLGALGVKTKIVGIVGEDEAGERLSCKLCEHQIDIDGLYTHAPTTSQKSRILAGAFGTKPQQVLRVDDEARLAFNSDIETWILNVIQKQKEQTDLIIFSDYGFNVMTPKLFEYARTLSQEHRPVLVDSRYRLAHAKGVTAIKPNIPEAEALVGYPIMNQASVEQAGADIIQNMKCSICLITQGSQGMTLFAKSKNPLHTNVVGSQEVTDVTGAGDTVSAVFGVSIAACLGSHNAMKLANAAAGIAVNKLGAAAITSTEISQVFQRYQMELDAWER